MIIVNQIWKVVLNMKNDIRIVRSFWTIYDRLKLIKELSIFDQFFDQFYEESNKIIFCKQDLENRIIYGS